jgi:phosphate transport system permease protein
LTATIVAPTTSTPEPPADVAATTVRGDLTEGPAEVHRALRARTLDEWASLIGSGRGSLALVWLVYEQLLAWSGILGFLVCWWVAFLGMFALVTALSSPGPIVRDKLASTVVQSAAALVGFALLTTVITIFDRGWPALHHLNFFTEDMSGVRPTASLNHGGILHAIVGSALQIAIAVAISLPLGIGTAVYMTEVGGRTCGLVRTVVEAMTALPDILAGLFIYAVLIIQLHWDRTGLAAALALAVTMIPIIARSAEVVLRVVPGGLREAGLALGASHWQTVRRVVIPTARSGLATALILGIARCAGETAPLLIVSGASTYFNANPTKEPMNSLPLFIYSGVRSGEPLFIARGYGAASVLLALVLILFTLTRYFARDKVSR